ncbi:hypothetical protein NP493_1013g01047 [Ridgeia piscesae]|uniref:Tetraspanin n=1 Tax=Ridgeia piscesae TaxID=27915 RepID=A0AAD9NLV1_RIDPI|nr:hypothetical protein NP493_1013g01047 [Ridgeia piscesae]
MLEMLSRIPYQGESLKTAVVKTSLLDKSALVLIVLGAFIFIIGACGIYGAMQRSRKLLYIYIAVVTAVVLLEIAALGTSAYFKNMVKARLKTFLQHTITKKYRGAGITTEGRLDPDADPLSSAWDFAMGYLECCGNTNYTDFMAGAERWNSTYSFRPAGTNTSFVVNATVPPMCCKMVDHSKFPGDITDIEFVDIRGCLEYPRQVNANLEPCYDKLYAVFLQYIKLALLIVASVILLEVRVHTFC